VWRSLTAFGPRLKNPQRSTIGPLSEGLPTSFARLEFLRSSTRPDFPPCSVSRLRCLLVGRCCRIYLGYTGTPAPRAFSAALIMARPVPRPSALDPSPSTVGLRPPDRHGGLAMLVDAPRQHAAATSLQSSRRRERRRRPRQVQARPEPHATAHHVRLRRDRGLC
jgi:hypothetical protein